LHIRLPALRTDKHAFHIMNFPRFFHIPTPCLFGPRIA
jgi:hypothetical protein